jgi:trk system potassium uptake protein TrkH
MEKKTTSDTIMAQVSGFLKKLLLSIMFFSTLLIFFLEFFYDLKKEIFLNRVVLALDIVLLISFFLLVILRIIKNHKILPVLIRMHKADTAYLFLIIAFLVLPRLAAGLVMGRLIISFLTRLLETRFGSRVLAFLNLRPSQTLALGFIGLIIVGTLLLTFPAATTDGHGVLFIDALFTMTSASCVAGFTVFDVGMHLTRFGQAVILLAIQIGGLGIMVLSAAFAVLVGGKIPSRKQMGLSEVLDVASPEGLKKLIYSVTATTVVMELAGAMSLFFMLREQIPKAGDRLWWSIFHAVSAFCNCGMTLSKDSLVSLLNFPLACFVIMSLVTIGGIGFFVISDLTSFDVWQVKKPRAIWNRLEIQTKVVIMATIFLHILGMLLFLFYEYDGALYGLSSFKKVWASLFYSVNLRSAGFFVVPIGAIAAPTILFSIAFMFIGAAPGSTGGGIKLTTAAVSIVALRAMLRGRDDVELFGRQMPPSIVNRSLSIVMVSAMVVLIFLTMLLATQEIAFEKLFFEIVSAFGTAGLSLDATLLLNNMGKILIICVMYVGRIGPLTLALAIGERRMVKSYTLPKGRIAVG